MDTRVVVLVAFFSLQLSQPSSSDLTYVRRARSSQFSGGPPYGRGNGRPYESYDVQFYPPNTRGPPGGIPPGLSGNGPPGWNKHGPPSQRGPPDLNGGGFPGSNWDGNRPEQSRPGRGNGRPYEPNDVQLYPSDNRGPPRVPTPGFSGNSFPETNKHHPAGPPESPGLNGGGFPGSNWDDDQPNQNKPGRGNGPPHKPDDVQFQPPDNRGPPHGPTPGFNGNGFPDPNKHRPPHGTPPPDGVRPEQNPHGPPLNENDAPKHDFDNVQDNTSQRPLVHDGNVCRVDEYRCLSGECLPEALRCDSKKDCHDGSDEVKCITTSDRIEDSTEQRTGCVLPEPPDGGDYELGGCGTPCNKRPGDKVPRNSILTYTCRKGYVLSGNTITACIDDHWYMPPTCLKTCPPLESSSVDVHCEHQGKVAACSDPIKPGTTATLQCKNSYKLPVTNDPGYREISCLPEGLWDRTIFRCLPECGTAASHGNTLIINGFKAKIGAFPWHVAVYDKNSKGNYVQICGGTLISERLVVSAAHCFYDDSLNRVRGAANFAIAAGKYYRKWAAEEDYMQKSLVEEIRVADRYMGARGNFAEDIALVKLKSPFQFTALVRPICLDWDDVYEREQLQVGQSGKVVGWGKTEEGVASESLQEINLPFVSYSQCLSSVPPDFRGYITSDKFCAGYLNGSSLCDGDSGGGLCFEMQGVWYLRGIVSVSPVKEGSCDYNTYVGFTSVSYFRQWIRDTYVST